MEYQKISIQKLDQILNSQVASVLAQRFKITDYPENTIRQMLLLCYKAEVEMRGCKYSEDELTNQRVSKAAKWLCNDCKPGLMLYGRVGSGKSTLARAICRLIGTLFDSNFTSERIYVYRCSALDLCKIVADEAKFANIKRQDMLFIDDIGMEQSTIKIYGNEISPVTELIYSRYDDLKLTIVTSNLKGDEFRQRYGERVGDRMRELFELIEFEQSLSYRK